MPHRLQAQAILALLLGASSALPAGAQATLRPVPRIAHSWSAAEAPRIVGSHSTESEPVVRAVNAGYDLDFIGPPRADRGPGSSQGQPRGATASTRFTSLEVQAFGIAASEFSDAPGQLSTQRGGWKAAFGSYRPERVSYAIEVGTEASFYDFGGGASPVSGVTDPFNDVYDTSLSGRFLIQHSADLEFYGGAQFGLAGEDRAALSDSVYVGAALAMRYRAADQFALLAGVAGVSRFEDTPWILPYIGFDWQVTERLRVLTEAAEVNVDWRVGEDWTLGALAAYDFRQYRLNRSGPLNGGAFRDEEIRVGGTLAWKAREGMELGLEVGALLWREALFFDGEAGKVAEAETGSPLYLRVGLKVSF